jgi:phage terminase small subunit
MMSRGRTNETDQRKNFKGKPRPPAHLSDAERSIWTRVCAKQTPEWCDLAASGALLEMYCVALAHYRLLCAARAALMATAAATEGEATIDLGKRLATASNLSNGIANQASHVAMLETKLRLTPQSRIRADRAGNEPPSPWDPLPSTDGSFPEDDGDTT